MPHVGIAMEAKNLKRLSRRELLEVMVKISEENETLATENETLKAQLEDRRLSAREVGSLSHACLEANGYFHAAESAARQYLDNIIQLEEETKIRCGQLLEETLTEIVTMRAAAGYGPDELIPEEWFAVQAPQAAEPLPEQDWGLEATPTPVARTDSYAQEQAANQPYIQEQLAGQTEAPTLDGVEVTVPDVILGTAEAEIYTEAAPASEQAQPLDANTAGKAKSKKGKTEKSKGSKNKAEKPKRSLFSRKKK